MNDPIIFDPEVHSILIPSLVSIHMECITSAPYTIATFLPPLQPANIQKWWEDRVKEVNEGTRVIIMQMTAHPAIGKEEVAGYVMLGTPFSQTGPFRGAVEKLLVPPQHRRKGIARLLMAKLEQIAIEKGRTLLVGASKLVLARDEENADSLSSCWILKLEVRQSLCIQD